MLAVSYGRSWLAGSRRGGRRRRRKALWKGSCWAARVDFGVCPLLTALVCVTGVSVWETRAVPTSACPLPHVFGIHAPALEELNSPPPHQPVRDEGAARRGEGAALWRASSGLVPVPMGVLPYHLPCVLQVTPEILASSSLLLFNCRSISAV